MADDHSGELSEREKRINKTISNVFEWVGWVCTRTFKLIFAMIICIAYSHDDSEDEEVKDINNADPYDAPGTRYTDGLNDYKMGVDGNIYKDTGLN